VAQKRWAFCKTIAQNVVGLVKSTMLIPTISIQTAKKRGTSTGKGANRVSML